MTINKERVELFCQALESDRYHQCQKVLRASLELAPIYDQGNVTVTYNCALGVAIEVAMANDTHCLRQMHEGRYIYWDSPDLPWFIADWYGFERPDPRVLYETSEGERLLATTALNDGMELSFWDIAQAYRRTYLKDEG